MPYVFVPLLTKGGLLAMEFKLRLWRITHCLCQFIVYNDFTSFFGYLILCFFSLTSNLNLYMIITDIYQIYMYIRRLVYFLFKHFKINTFTSTHGIEYILGRESKLRLQNSSYLRRIIASYFMK